MKPITKTLFIALLGVLTSVGAANASSVSGSGNVDPTGRDVHSEAPADEPLLSWDGPLAVPAHAHGPNDPWCGTDLTSEEAKANLAQIKADRAAGKYALARKGFADPDVGDRQVFNVSEDSWIELEFELVDKTSLYYLWVEVAELANGNVDQNKIDQLKSSVHDSTPSRSINPGQGTFANNHDIFGLPPNMDGDGFVDILMYDIGRGSGSTLGYVSSTDQLLNPPAGSGNQRDVLYLDSNEGTRNFSWLAAVAAHEYTHLIHLSYGWDQTFITEGMAEYSMVMNGFYLRSVIFVSSPFEVSQPLFTWEPPPNPADEKDYQRAGLFYTYIGEQFGAEVVGQMMRDTQKKGAAGMDSVLALHGSNLSDVILDYHTANRVNDKSLDSRFGYNEPERSSHMAFLSSPPIDGEVPSSLGEGGFAFEYSERVNSGSVQYLLLNNAADLNFIYDTPDPTGLFYSQYLLRNRGRVITEDSQGVRSFTDFLPSKSGISIDGEFKSVTFILVQDNPDIGGNFASISAAWTPLSQATDVVEESVLPASFALESVYPNPFTDRATVSVSLDRTSPVQLSIVDMLGRVRTSQDHGLLAAGAHNLEFDAGSLDPGTYIVRVSSDNRTDSQLVTLVR